MKFKYSVIGDNTSENIEHLEKIGYEFEETNKRFTPCIYTNDNCVYFVSESFALAIAIDVREKYVNCRGNDDLFKAVTAIRDKYKDLIKQHTTDFYKPAVHLTFEENE